MRTRIREARTVQVERAETPLTLGELEKDHIAEVLAATRGNKRLAAQLLGIDRRTLYRKLERYGISIQRAG